MSKKLIALAIVVVVIGVLVYLVQAPSYRRAKQFVRENPGTVQYQTHD